jgi:hypothetical protein
MSPEQRTTPYGLWRYAKDFAVAGHAAKRVSEQHLFAPAYYLMGHSIELSLKAFLLGRGISLAQLKGRLLGHDLDALFKLSRHHQIGREVKLSKFDGAAIHLLNVEYMTKRFEYIRTGMVHVPDWHYVANAADRLVSELESYCVELVKGKR